MAEKIIRRITGAEAEKLEGIRINPDNVLSELGVHRRFRTAKGEILHRYFPPVESVAVRTRATGYSFSEGKQVEGQLVEVDDEIFVPILEVDLTIDEAIAQYGRR